MPGPAFAEGEAVSLHPIEDEDHEFIQRYRNHPDVRVPLTDSRIRTLGDVAESVEDDDYRFLICVEGGDGDEPVPVGEVAFAWVQSEGERGALMYWVAPEHRGNGYVTEASELFLDYVFRECGFHKVSARVLVSNEASAGALEKLGFQQEGRRREATVVDGEYEDMFTYGLLAREWLAE